MGIRKKILFGFLFLALMLLLSGAISLFELNRLTSNSRELLEKSSYSMSLCSRMLEGIEEENNYMLRMIASKGEPQDSTLTSGLTEFKEALSEATKTVKDRTELDAIYQNKELYDKFAYTLSEPNAAENKQLVEQYLSAYANLSKSVREYMISSQHSLSTQAEELKNSAHRAIAPGIVSLAVAIIMMILFAFLIDLYYAKPTVKIAKGLRSYLTNKVHFSVEDEGNQEIIELKKDIETLIDISKNRQME